ATKKEKNDNFINNLQKYISLSKDLSERAGADISINSIGSDNVKNIDIALKLKLISEALSNLNFRRFDIKANPFYEIHEKSFNDSATTNSNNFGIESGVKWLVLDEYSYLTFDISNEVSLFNDNVNGIKQLHIALYLSPGFAGNVGLWGYNPFRLDPLGYRIDRKTELIAGMIVPTSG